MNGEERMGGNEDGDPQYRCVSQSSNHMVLDDLDCLLNRPKFDPSVFSASGLGVIADGRLG